MNLAKNLHTLLFILCSKFMGLYAVDAVTFHLVDDVICNDYLTRPDLSLVQVSSRSKLDCARQCAKRQDCLYFRASKSSLDKLCEIITFNEVSKSKSGRRLLPTITPLANTSCYELDAGSPQESLPDADGCPGQSSDLHKGQWIKFIDSNLPDTQTTGHMKTRSYLEEAKLVYLDDTRNEYHVLAINNVFVTPLNHLFFTMAYAMEKDEFGFKANANRIVFSVTYQGDLHTGFINPNGSSWTRPTSLSQMKIFVQEPEEYSEKFSKADVNMETLVAHIKRGQKVNGFKYSFIIDNGAKLDMYNLNVELSLGLTGGLDEPLSYRQFLQVFPSYALKFTHPFGAPGPVRSFGGAQVHDLELSTLWCAHNSSLDTEPIATKNARLMSQGHKFRVAFDDGYFDVDVVTKVGNDMFFDLPEQVSRTDGQKVSNDGNNRGVRGVVSLLGDYSWCSHPAETQAVLESDFRQGLLVQTFVDRKQWTPVLSVFSNGTVLSGSAADVATASIGGKDLNILLEWLDEDRSKLLAQCMVTIKDHDSPGVLITAESRVAWVLHTMRVHGNTRIDADCNMQKFLFRSNGQVQLLEYNVQLRKDVEEIQNARTTWFVY